MTRSAIVGSGRLLPMSGARTGQTEALEGPWVIIIEAGLIAEVRCGGLRPGDPEAVHDVGMALLTPGLVDPHTHLIFAGDRADEAAARSHGQPYSGGGILRTVRATGRPATGSSSRPRDDASVPRSAVARPPSRSSPVTAWRPSRSCACSDSSGSPRRHCPCASCARSWARTPSRPGSTPAQQADAVVAALPQVAPSARFIDVFCEPGLFDLELSRRILAAGRRHGLGLRLHADQLQRSGAARLGVDLGALSVDHLEQASAADARAIAHSDTVATILPGPALLLRSGAPPVRELVAAGATVAIGSDANAGTFGVPSMPLAVGLAVALGLSVDEALWAATAGAARSLGLGGQIGVIRPGAAADLVAWDAAHEGDFAVRVGAVAPVSRWFGGQRDA